MNATNSHSSDPASDWIRPHGEQGGLSSYVQTIRERLWIVVLAVVLTTGVAIVYVVTAPKTYEADAGVLVTPVPPESELLIRLGLFAGSSDPTRDIQTVASLVTTTEVAERAQTHLKGVPEAAGTPEELLEHVTADPVAESNIVNVRASAGSPDDAAAIANAVAEALITQRTNVLHRRVREQLDLLQGRLEADSQAPGSGLEISQLEGLLASEDPTIQIATRAVAPTDQASPRPVLSIAGGLVAGLVLGFGAAFAYQALDPRLRREEQLRRMFNLPILARIPRESRRPSGVPLAPRALSPAASEAYRTLRATLAASASQRAGGGRTILVTGSSPSDGKTTTALNLAASLAASGKRVILIEADLRRPAIGRALGVTPQAGLVGVMLENVPLGEALLTTDRYGPNLDLLLADYEGDLIGEIFGLPVAGQLLEEARGSADFVVIDSPPLVDVVDALPLARMVDSVLVVARLGNAQISKLTQLGELLAENGIRPIGVVLVGTPRPRRRDYHYYHEGERRILASAGGQRSPSAGS